eukprot:Awhi_evm1s10381
MLSLSHSKVHLNDDINSNGSTKNNSNNSNNSDNSNNIIDNTFNNSSSKIDNNNISPRNSNNNNNNSSKNGNNDDKGSDSNSVMLPDFVLQDFNLNAIDAFPPSTNLQGSLDDLENMGFVTNDALCSTSTSPLRLDSVLVSASSSQANSSVNLLNSNIGTTDFSNLKNFQAVDNMNSLNKPGCSPTTLDSRSTSPSNLMNFNDDMDFSSFGNYNVASDVFTNNSNNFMSETMIIPANNGMLTNISALDLATSVPSLTEAFIDNFVVPGQPNHLSKDGITRSDSDFFASMSPVSPLTSMSMTTSPTHPSEKLNFKMSPDFLRFRTQPECPTPGAFSICNSPAMSTAPSRSGSPGPFGNSPDR